MLKISDIEVRYSNSREDVLRKVSLYVESGEIVCIVGANGAGKSTLINTISGLVKVGSGSIEFLGRPLSANASEVVRAGIVQVPEGRRVFAPLTVRENLIMGGYHSEKSVCEKNMEEMFSLFPILGQRALQHAGTLSGGEQQMLAIARAMMANPKLLLLDEPSLGIAPIVAKEIFSYLAKINKERGLPLLIVEQNAKMALGISSRVYVLEMGKIAMEGPTEVVANDPHVIEAYFGGRTT
jgi:branched-chain amino acid transport system ATP-binding protein